MRASTAATATGAATLKRNFWWLRDPGNPVLPPGPPGSFDAACTMNPCALRIGGEYHLYYAGGAADGTRRICLATASVTAQLADPDVWTRHGPLFDVGPARSFDASWCVLPHVVQVAPDRWHLYYTGRSDHGEGLSAFPGLGLAVSRDGKRWERHPGNPILAPTHRPGDPDAIGMAGGSVLRARLPDGGHEWRFYYTGCPTLGEDVFLNQQKISCLAVSQDGIHWERRGPVLRRNPDHDYENVAAAGPVVRQEADGTFRMWYSAIGTRWGYYSIGYAESDDGLHWRRGAGYGANLQLGPTGSGWERQMVEYPSVLPDAADPTGSRLRLFYCGNGYGVSGIGTAISSPLRATPEAGAPTLRVVAAGAPSERPVECLLRLPGRITCDGQPLDVLPAGSPNAVRWYGPTAVGTSWYEWQSSAGVDGLQYRVLVLHDAEGLGLRFTLVNGSPHTYHALAISTVIDRSGSEAPVAVTWNGEDGAVAGTPDNATIVLDALSPGETRTLRAAVTLIVLA